MSTIVDTTRLMKLSTKRKPEIIRFDSVRSSASTWKVILVLTAEKVIQTCSIWITSEERRSIAFLG